MGPYLIDTNAVIDFFNGRLPAKGQQLLAGISPAISAITHIELFSSSKLTEAERVQLQRFVEILTIYDTLSANIVAQTISGGRENVMLPELAVVKHKGIAAIQ